MVFIESFIQEYICDLWVYWLLVFISLYFRYENLQYSFLPTNRKVYKIAVDIGVVLFLTLSIGGMGKVQTSSTAFEIFVITILLLYCFCTLNSKCENGTTESLLVVVNGIYVTYLSFTSWPTSFVFAIIIITISFFISRYRNFENISEFWEITLLSVESILISATIYFNNLTSFYHTFLIVLFNGTMLTLINVLIVYYVKKWCGEDAEGYLQRVVNGK